MTCDVNKIDSNVTGLSYAEEACLKVLPTVAADGHDPIWYTLEPNSYSDFGGNLTTVARQPISAARQRQKGTVTGFEASGGFNQDLTQTNLTRLMQGFFAANARQKPAIQPLNGSAIVLTSAASADNSFNAAAGLTRFFVNHLLKASKMTNNVGVHLVSTVATGKIVVTTTLVNDTPPADAQLEAVGFQFPSGAVSLTASTAAAVLGLTGLAAGVGTFTISSTNNALADETVTIGAQIYTFKAAPTAPAILGANEVLIGVDKAASCANLAAAINHGSGAGSLYGALTPVNTQVTAVGGAGTVVVTAILQGASGNAIATTDTVTNGSWGAATLASGTGGPGWRELGIVPGEWIYVGGDLTGQQFTQVASTNRPGYARASAVTDALLTLDDTTWTPQTDAGTGKTIRVYFGTVIRNEPLPADIVLRSYNIERTLGKDSSGLTQAQYLEGAIPNEFKLNVPDSDKLNADLSFIATNDSTKTGLEGLKTGVHVPAPGETAFNTSVDLYRIRMAIYDPAVMNKSALFGFVQEASLTINNNTSPVKALGKLGAIDVSVGNFDAGGSVTALFSTVDAIRAIRNNADVGLSFIAARANGGFVFDIPLLGVGGGRLNIQLNEPITVPLEASGAQNARGYTMLSVWFAYLPNIAMPS